MAEKSPVVLTWLTICIGVIFVLVGIGAMTLVNNAAGLSIPGYAISAIGAAIGVAAWMVWARRRQGE